LPNSPAMHSRSNDPRPPAADQRQPPRFVYPKKSYFNLPPVLSMSSTTLWLIVTFSLLTKLRSLHPFMQFNHPQPASPNQALYHQYCATVHRIHTNPGQATSSSCIVCGDTHRFDAACPILKNTEFLCLHYIHYCQHLKRDASAHATTFKTPSPDRPVCTVAVSNQYDVLLVASLHSASSHGTVQDFPLGRV
jgi:hypothetical protein